MKERWAVAFETDSIEDGMFMWARTAGGDLAVFKSKTDAQKWVLTCLDIPRTTDKVVFIRIPAQ